MRRATILGNTALAFAFVGCNIEAPLSPGIDVDAGPCGDSNQICCVPYMCHGDLTCLGARCRHCGDQGEPCCPFANLCAAGLTCRQPIDTGNLGYCAPTPDGADPRCITTCVQQWGQYCSRISNNCGLALDCGECAVSGFTCGGAELSHVCGAAQDSGICDVTMCEAPTGGHALDCGACPGGQLCGEHVQGVYGSPDASIPPPPLPREPPPPPPLPPPNSR
jgi:hypothetical protein